MATATAIHAEVAARMNRRLAWGLLVSLLLHAIVLSLQFGIPGLRPGPPAPITVRLAPPAPALAPEPQPAAAPQPEVPAGIAAPAAPAGLRLVDPAAAPQPALPQAGRHPARRAGRSSRATRLKAVETPVIARDQNPEASFVVPLPQAEQAPELEPQQATAAPAEEGAGTATADGAAKLAADEAAELERETQRLRMAELQAQQRAEQARQAAIEQQRQAAEEEQRQALARQRELDELAARRQAEQLALRRQAEDEARRQADLDARRKAEELAQQLAEQQARRRAEELAQQQAEQQARRRADELAQQQLAGELAARRRADELALQAARQPEPAAGEPSLAAAPPAAGDGGKQGQSAAASLPRNMLGSDAANRARALVRGLDILGAPPPAVRERAGGEARRAVVSGAERDVPLRLYVDSFRQKVERNGSLNHAQQAAGRVRIDPLVSVTLRNDGSVEDVTILRSSGHPDTDEAVRRIVRINARYSAFPPNVAARFDVIEIRRIWAFAEGLKLLEELR